MLITIDDYKKYYDVKDGQDELINNLLTVSLQYIESILGYSLETASRSEKVDYSSRVYLMCRPVKSIESVKLKNDDDVAYEFLQGNNFIDVENECCVCGNCPRYLYIIYTAGYDKLSELIKYLICSLVQSLLDGMEDESRKYTSYKINDIAYAFKNFASERQSEVMTIIEALRW